MYQSSWLQKVLRGGLQEWAPHPFWPNAGGIERRDDSSTPILFFARVENAHAVAGAAIRRNTVPFAKRHISQDRTSRKSGTIKHFVRPRLVREV
jgi:hypothetical protein